MLLLSKLLLESSLCLFEFLFIGLLGKIIFGLPSLVVLSDSFLDEFFVDIFFFLSIFAFQFFQLFLRINKNLVALCDMRLQFSEVGCLLLYDFAQLFLGISLLSLN